MAKKSETWALLFFIIWVSGGILLVPLYIYYIVSHPIAALIAYILWGIVGIMSLNIYSQRADLEKWAYSRLQSEWKLIENPLSTVPSHLSWVSLVTSTMSIIIYGLLILSLFLAFYLVALFWIDCGRDINKFGEIINNYISIILVFIFMTQAWIFYQQYRHMRQPLFKTPFVLDVF